MEHAWDEKEPDKANLAVYNNVQILINLYNEDKEALFKLLTQELNRLRTHKLLALINSSYDETQISQSIEALASNIFFLIKYIERIHDISNSLLLPNTNELVSSKILNSDIQMLTNMLNDIQPSPNNDVKEVDTLPKAPSGVDQLNSLIKEAKQNSKSLRYNEAFEALTSAFSKLNSILEQKSAPTHKFFPKVLPKIASRAKSLIKHIDSKNHYHLAILREMLGDILKLGELHNIQIEIYPIVKYAFYLNQPTHLKIGDYKNCYLYTPGNKLLYIDSDGKTTPIPLKDSNNFLEAITKKIDGSQTTDLGNRLDLSYEGFKDFITPLTGHIPTNYNNILDNYKEARKQLGQYQNDHPKLNSLNQKIDAAIYRERKNQIINTANTEKNASLYYSNLTTQASNFKNNTTKANTLKIANIEMRKLDNKINPLEIKSDPAKYRCAISDFSSGFFAGIWHAATRKPLDIKEQTNLAVNLNGCLTLDENQKQTLINKIVAGYEESSSCLSFSSDSSADLLKQLKSIFYSPDEKWNAIDSYMLEQFSETNKMLKNNGKRLFMAVYDVMNDEAGKKNQTQKNPAENSPLITNSTIEKII